MRISIAAAFALLTPSSVGAQDLSTAMPIAGNWTYAPVTGGSEAVFANAAGSPQLWVHCTRATRRVTISRPASAAAPSMNIWTTSRAQSVGSDFNPGTGRVTIDLAPFDPLLDALVSSRGRIAFAIGTQP